MGGGAERFDPEIARTTTSTATAAAGCMDVFAELAAPGRLAGSAGCRVESRRRLVVCRACGREPAGKRQPTESPRRARHQPKSHPNPKGEHHAASWTRRHKTFENLKAAFAGESQANRRYLYFAKQADVEGSRTSPASSATPPRARPATPTATSTS